LLTAARTRAETGRRGRSASDPLAGRGRSEDDRQAVVDRREDPMGCEFPARAVLGVVLLISLSLVAATSAVAAVSEASPDAPIDLNSATVEQLTTIPGIGKVMAKRIVAWREEHGPFRRVEDLIKVKGIGEKTFEKLRPYVTVESSR
jgi:comEA protein